MPTPDIYHIVLADDHVLLRQDLKKILEEKTNIKVVGEAGDGLELLDLLKLRELTPDMIILDISMPNLSGIEAARRIKVAYPKVKILILSMYKIKEYVFSTLSAGADGYLLKEDAGAELFSAIKKIQKGKIYISPLLSRELTNDGIKSCSGRGLTPSGADEA